MKALTLYLYTTHTGKQPFADWLEDLDKKTGIIVDARLARLRQENFGDCKPIKGSNGVYELRIDYGAGYRVYFGKKGSTVVILLTGGDKGSQTRDIAKAKQYWHDFRERNHD